MRNFISKLIDKHRLTLPKESLATLDRKIVEPEIAVKFEMRDASKVHAVRT